MSEIRLYPSWYGKIPLEKGSNVQSNSDSDKDLKVCYGGNENDKYVSPVYNELKDEYLATVKPYSKLPTLEEKNELDDIIRPLYKHLLGGMEFYKFYLNKVKNVVLDRNITENIITQIPISNKNMEIYNAQQLIVGPIDDILDNIEPVEEIDKYKLKSKKLYDNYDYEDDFDDKNYNYSDDDYNMYSDFEAR